MDFLKLNDANMDDFLNVFQEYQTFCNYQSSREQSREFFQAMLSNPEKGAVILASTGDQRVTGFAILYIQASSLVTSYSCHLSDLYVCGEARGAGAGRGLVDASILFAKENNFKSLKWTTDAKNIAAQKLYEKFNPSQALQIFYRLKF